MIDQKIGEVVDALSDRLTESMRLVGGVYKGVVVFAMGSNNSAGHPPAYLTPIIPGKRELIALLRLTEDLEEVLKKLREELAKPVYGPPKLTALRTKK